MTITSCDEANCGLVLSASEVKTLPLAIGYLELCPAHFESRMQAEADKADAQLAGGVA